MPKYRHVVEFKTIRKNLLEQTILIQNVGVADLHIKDIKFLEPNKPDLFNNAGGCEGKLPQMFATTLPQPPTPANPISIKPAREFPLTIKFCDDTKRGIYECDLQLITNDPNATDIKYRLRADILDNEVTDNHCNNRHSGFGMSVDVAENGNNVYAIVGAPNCDNGTGRAYIYKLDNNGGWIFVEELKPQDGHNLERFGWDVAIHVNPKGEWEAAVGAPNHNANECGGAVYLFGENGFNKKTVLPSSIGDRKDAEFGKSIAMTENFMVIAGAAKVNAAEGVALLFDDSENYLLLQPYVDPASRHAKGFGIDVAIYENHIVVGANTDSPNNPDPQKVTGALHYFSKTKIDLTNQPSRANATDRIARATNSFGRFISINNRFIIVNAPTRNEVYSYDLLSNPRFEEKRVPTTSPAPGGSRFESISISDNSLLAVAEKGGNSIQIFEYDNATNKWASKPTQSGVQSSLFGTDVAISDQHLIVGAYVGKPDFDPAENIPEKGRFYFFQN